MAPGFMIIFLVFVAAFIAAAIAVYLLLIAGFAALFLYAWWKEWKTTRWVSLGLVVILIAGGIVGTSYTALQLYRAVRFTVAPNQADLASIYQVHFSIAPPPGVQLLHGKVAGWGDWADAFLQIKSDELTLKQIIPAAAHEATVSVYQSKNGGMKPPSWWIEPSPQARIFIHEPPYGKGKSFASEITIFTYEPSTGILQMYFTGID